MLQSDDVNSDAVSNTNNDHIPFDLALLLVAARGLGAGICLALAVRYAVYPKMFPSSAISLDSKNPHLKIVSAKPAQAEVVDSEESKWTLTVACRVEI